MRDIKFRGKDLYSGEWVHGLIQHPLLGEEEVLAMEYAIDDTYGLTEIDPDTVGQFTGLKDKNGVEIYESDIVEHKGQRYVIEYSVEYVRFIPLMVDRWLAGFNLATFEVIGNIHDNPELLEVVK